MRKTVGIIGSGPTGIYTLSGLLDTETPLAITVFEAEADAGKGTPYHPDVNDRAMLANIASYELPPVNETLVDWLNRQADERLAELGLARTQIHERAFYPRVVLGAYFQSQFQQLLNRNSAHLVTVKPYTGLSI